MPRSKLEFKSGWPHQIYHTHLERRRMNDGRYIRLFPIFVCCIRFILVYFPKGVYFWWHFVCALFYIRESITCLVKLFAR